MDAATEFLMERQRLEKEISKLEREVVLLRAAIDKSNAALLDACHLKDERDAALLRVEQLQKSESDLLTKKFDLDTEVTKQANRAFIAERLNSEMLKRVEEFKCSAKAEECTARHFGYNLAIDDVLEILREPLKRNDEDPRKGCVDFGHKGPCVSAQEGLDWVSRCHNCGEQVH